jgi:hypothetical protein
LPPGCPSLVVLIAAVAIGLIGGQLTEQSMRDQIPGEKLPRKGIVLLTDSENLC